MATVETEVESSPRRCFGVLSDPLSYEYWVVGSRRIRAADPEWPALGSRFDHTAGVLPLKSRDHTEVEAVEPERLLRLRARARPFGTALVTLTMEGEGEGEEQRTRLRLEEGPADTLTKLFYNPLLDRVVHRRNETSIRRLKELAEGREPIPAHELPPRERNGESGPGGGAVARAAAGFGRGALAGLLGGAAMTASTVTEMKLTGRAASKVPVRAVEKLLGVRARGERAEARVTGVAHFLVAGLTGAAWGAVAKDSGGAKRGAPALFAIAALPDTAIVPAMGLAAPPWRWPAADLGRTAIHHAVYTAAAVWSFTRLGD